MGNDRKEVQERGPRQTPTASRPVPTGDTSALRNSIESLEAPESMPVPGSTCAAFVDGKRVTHLYCILRHPMFLITDEFGTHETSRVYVTPGKIRIGDRMNNLFGPARVSQVLFTKREGLTVITDKGTMFSPAQDCQLTWRDE